MKPIYIYIYDFDLKMLLSDDPAPSSSYSNASTPSNASRVPHATAHEHDAHRLLWTAAAKYGVCVEGKTSACR